MTYCRYYFVSILALFSACSDMKNIGTQGVMNKFIFDYEENSKKRTDEYSVMVKDSYYTLSSCGNGNDKKCKLSVDWKVVNTGKNPMNITNFSGLLVIDSQSRRFAFNNNYSIDKDTTINPLDTLDGYVFEYLLPEGELKTNEIYFVKVIDREVKWKIKLSPRIQKSE